MSARQKGDLGLILTGGGARSAYQVGVLQGIARLLPRKTPSPFPVLCGTSAGAINAVAIAAHAGCLRQGVGRLASVWANMSTAQIFRSDSRALVTGALRWTLALLVGSRRPHRAVSLLDATPLRETLSRRLPLGGIDQAIADGWLRAVSVTALSYGHAQSVSFFQGRPDVTPWERAQRRGAPVRLDINHLMASAAIPFLFRAVDVGGEYYGDGSMRQTAPISPALHLGAERVMLIDVNGPVATRTRSSVAQYPSFAHIGGHILNSIFLDSLEADLERLQRTNDALVRVSRVARSRLGMRRIDACLVAPSVNLSEIAFQHRHHLPRALRALLARIGALGEEGADLVSYLLFEKAYCRELMALGCADALRRQDEILTFLDVAFDAGTDTRGQPSSA